MSTNRMPKVYATTHPSDPGLCRVMWRDSRGTQRCLIDRIDDPREADRLAEAVAERKPYWWFEAKEAARAVHDGPIGRFGEILG